MDADLMAKWLAVLRGGEFKQARGRLRHGDKYCCLGVLCVVAELPIDECGESIVGDKTGYDSIHRLLGDQDFAQDLWWENDRHGKTFSEIADYIEARPVPSQKHADGQ